MLNESGKVAAAKGRERALSWLRDVLAATVDVAPIPLWAKRATCCLIRRAPDWVIRTWAEALNVDYLTAQQMYPNLAQQVKSHTGREIMRQYVEAHNAVLVLEALRQLVRKVMRLSKKAKLPADGDAIGREVCALALTTCAPYGKEFAQSASSILGHADRSDSFLIEYQSIIDRGQRNKLEELDFALTGTPYGKWIAQRISEMKRWLGLDMPQFNIQYGERRPQWDILWKAIFTGGKK